MRVTAPSNTCNTPPMHQPNPPKAAWYAPALLITGGVGCYSKIPQSKQQQPAACWDGVNPHSAVGRRHTQPRGQRSASLPPLLAECRINSAGRVQHKTTSAAATGIMHALLLVSYCYQCRYRNNSDHDSIQPTTLSMHMHRGANTSTCAPPPLKYQLNWPSDAKQPSTHGWHAHALLVHAARRASAAEHAAQQPFFTTKLPAHT